MTSRLLIFLVALAAMAGSALAAETTIKGGRMELVGQGDSVIFTDNVHLVRGIDDIRASEMRTNKKRDFVSARGQVRLIRTASSTETWKGWGDEGYYDTKTGAGYLIGKNKKAKVTRIEIVSSTITRVMDIYAYRIDFKKDGRQASAAGKVEGNTVDPETNDEYVFYSEKADFDGQKNEVVLTGTPQPKVIQTLGQDKRTVIGDVITYYTDDRRMISEGNAQAYFIEQNPENKK